MGLRVVESTGLKRELPIRDGFVIEVKHLTRKEMERLNARCEGLDEDASAAEASSAYIAGWRGLTVPIARCLGVPVEDDQPTAIENGKNGYIAYDRDTARDLWRLAYTSKLMLPIMNFSRNMLEVIELEKAAAKNDSSGSSPRSTAP